MVSCTTFPQQSVCGACQNIVPSQVIWFVILLFNCLLFARIHFNPAWWRSTHLSCDECFCSCWWHIWNVWIFTPDQKRHQHAAHSCWIKSERYFPLFQHKHSTHNVEFRHSLLENEKVQFGWRQNVWEHLCLEMLLWGESSLPLGYSSAKSWWFCVAALWRQNRIRVTKAGFPCGMKSVCFVDAFSTLGTCSVKHPTVS